MLSMAGFTEALALRADVGVLGGVGMALRAVGLRRVQRGDTFRRVHPEFDIGEGANVQLGGAGYAADQLDGTVWGGCR